MVDRPLLEARMQLSKLFGQASYREKTRLGPESMTMLKPIREATP